MSTATFTAPRPDGILAPVAECLTPEVARRILAISIDPRIQTRVDELAARSKSGQLTPAERSEYERYVDDADLLGIVKSLARQVIAG
jgi:hypothetical protein